MPKSIYVAHLLYQNLRRSSTVVSTQLQIRTYLSCTILDMYYNYTQLNEKASY